MKATSSHATRCRRLCAWLPALVAPPPPDGAIPYFDRARRRGGVTTWLPDYWMALHIAFCMVKASAPQASTARPACTRPLTSPNVPASGSGRRQEQGVAAGCRRCPGVAGNRMAASMQVCIAGARGRVWRGRHTGWHLPAAQRFNSESLYRTVAAFNMPAGARASKAGGRTLRPLRRRRRQQAQEGSKFSLLAPACLLLRLLMVEHAVLHAPKHSKSLSRLQEMPPAAMRGVQLASRNRRPCGASSRSTLPRHSRASRMWRNGTHARPLNSAAGRQDSSSREVHEFEGSCLDGQCSLSCAFLRHTVFTAGGLGSHRLATACPTPPAECRGAALRGHRPPQTPAGQVRKEVPCCAHPYAGQTLEACMEGMQASSHTWHTVTSSTLWTMPAAPSLLTSWSTVICPALRLPFTLLVCFWMPASQARTWSGGTQERRDIAGCGCAGETSEAGSRARGDDLAQHRCLPWERHARCPGTWMLRFHPPSSRLFGVMPSTCSRRLSSRWPLATGHWQAAHACTATVVTWHMLLTKPASVNLHLIAPAPQPHTQHTQREQAPAQRLACLHAKPAEVCRRVPVRRHCCVQVFLCKLVQAQLQLWRVREDTTSDAAACLVHTCAGTPVRKAMHEDQHALLGNAGGSRCSCCLKACQGMATLATCKPSICIHTSSLALRCRRQGLCRWRAERPGLSSSAVSQGRMSRPTVFWAAREAAFSGPPCWGSKLQS